MALRLDDLVLCGEILNTKNYSTHGWLRLRGNEQTLLLQLTGNCDADLEGKHIRFRVPNADDLLECDAAPVDFDFSDLAWQQVGPTGTMTTARKVKVADCSPEELSRRTKLGDPPPLKWKRCLYLEWYSQNGRVVVELVDPVIEFVDDDAEDSLADGGMEADYGVADDEELDVLLEGGTLETEETDGVEIGDAWPLSLDENEAFDDEPSDDPYGLFPDGLQQQFDQEASELDWAIEDDQSKPESIRELELMDELIEGGEGDIIASIFEKPMKLPRPDQLDDEQVEVTLKSLLGQLALFGIALSICEHFTPRDAYRLLLEKICTEERAYPQLRQTQWVQHFMTSEFCEICEAEMDREFEEYERRRKENPNDDPIGDDDVPF